MHYSTDIDFDNEIFLGIDNGPANWQSIFGSTLYGALEPVLSFNKPGKTNPYLCSIKKICVTFLQYSTHFHFTLFSACCSFLFSLFLLFFPFFILFIFTFSFTLPFSAFPTSISLNYIRNIIFQLNCRKPNIPWILQTENFSKWILLLFFLVFPHLVKHFPFYKLLFLVPSFYILQTTDHSIRLISI